MLIHSIQEAMKRARYKILEDGTYFGEIPGLPGIWASERNLDTCRTVLQEVLEEWLILKIRDHGQDSEDGPHRPELEGRLIRLRRLR